MHTPNFRVPRCVIACFAVGLIAAACGDDDTGSAATASSATALSTASAETTTTSAASDASVVATDPLAVASCGADVTYDAPPERTVTVGVNTTEIMIELGLTDRLAGAFVNPDQLRPENKAAFDAAGVDVLGEEFPSPSLESVLGPDPDLVFPYAYSQEGGLTVEKLAANDVPFYFVPEVCPDFSGDLTIETTFDMIRDIGTIFGVQADAEALIESYQSRVDAAVAKIPADAEPPTVFHKDFTPDDGTIFTAGGRAVPSNVIELAGGVNVFADNDGDPGGVWFYATKEEIVAADPEWMAIVDYDDYDEQIASLEADPSLSATTAVTEGNYIRLTYTQILPGVQNIDALEAIVAALWT